MHFSHVILAHHGRHCPFCGIVMRVPAKHQGRATANRPDFPTRDHLIPRVVMPGQGTIIICQKCNADKGRRLVDEWHALLSERGDPRAETVAKWMRENGWSKHLSLRSPAAEDSP